MEEKQIEQMLKELPKVGDERSKAEVYQQIEQKLHMKVDVKRKFTFKHVFPVIAAFVILLSFSPLLLTELNKRGVEDHIPEEAIHQEMDMDNSNNESRIMMGVEVEEVTIATINKDEKVVSVTMEIPNNKESPMEKIKRAQAIIGEDEQFISAEPIFNSLELTEDETIATIVIDEENREYYTTHKEQMEEIVQLTLADTNVQTVIFQDEKEGVFEDRQEQVEVNHVSAKAPLYFYQSTTGNGMLIQDGEPEETIEEAIQQMKTAPNELYEPMIKADEEITLTDEGQTLIIHFKQVLDLENEHVYFIDSLIQLARNFNYNYVQFENTIQEQWQDYDLLQPIDVKNE